MKFITLLITLLTFVLSDASASDNIDFNNIFKNTRVGLFVDQHYNKLNGVYTALITYKKSEMELVNANIGYIEDVTENKNYPLAQLGLRVDSILKVIKEQSKNSVTVSELPQIEFGPFVSALFRREEGHLKTTIRYGLGLAIRL